MWLSTVVHSVTSNKPSFSIFSISWKTMYNTFLHFPPSMTSWNIWFGLDTKEMLHQGLNCTPRTKLQSKKTKNVHITWYLSQAWRVCSQPPSTGCCKFRYYAWRSSLTSSFHLLQHDLQQLCESIPATVFLHLNQIQNEWKFLLKISSHTYARRNLQTQTHK